VPPSDNLGPDLSLLRFGQCVEEVEIVAESNILAESTSKISDVVPVRGGFKSFEDRGCGNIGVEQSKAMLDGANQIHGVGHAREKA